jgi:Fe-S oxidoreductase
MWLEESIGRRINVTRVEQALPLSPKTIATACPYCAVMMADGLSALGRNDTVDTRDVAELVAAALLPNP